MTPRARAVVVILLASAWLAPAPPLTAQNAPPATPSPTPSPAPEPIPAIEIPARAGDVARQLREMDARARPGEAITAIAEALPGVERQITDLEEVAEPLLGTDGPPATLRDVEAELTRVQVKLKGWLDAIGRPAAALNDDLMALKQDRELWELTRDGAAGADLPAALVQQIRDTLRSIGAAEQKTGSRRAEVLTLQARVVGQQSRVGATLDEVHGEIQARQQHLYRFDSPPLWRALRGGLGSGEPLGAQMAVSMRKDLTEIRDYVINDAGWFGFQIVVFLALLALFIWLQRKAELWVRSDESLRVTTALLQRPVAASLLVTILLPATWMHPTAPDGFENLLTVFLILVIPRLLPRMVQPVFRPAVFMLVVLVGINLLVELVPISYLLDRLGYLLLALAGAGTCAWVARQLRKTARPPGTFWRTIAKWVGSIAGVLFAGSVVANVVGAVALATLATTATLASAYGAIVLWVFVAVLFGAVTVGLRTSAARRFLIVRYHGDRIRSVVFRIIKTIAVLGWIAYALESFGLFDAALRVLKRIVGHELRLGTFSLPVSGAVIFFVVFWLSFKLSQLVRFILDEDVLPRMDLPRGAPAAVSKMSHYLLLTLGFLFAVAAAGLDLSHFAIIVGALGVGIGFGLQNVVNNFVSGLILLFERPVNLGDRIQLGEISGVVQDIGIRASVVRTWQGADVVVPNASLISDNLVNWTLTDELRRMDIPAGVAYGTSPERVIELLLGVARAHPGVMDDPEARAIFTGFGSSSLDFELRAWTTGDFVTIASDLRVAINRALADQGIEIPFPQHDLHLRSVDGEAAAAFSDRGPAAAAPAPEPVDDGAG